MSVITESLRGVRWVLAAAAVAAAGCVFIPPEPTVEPDVAETVAVQQPAPALPPVAEPEAAPEPPPRVVREPAARDIAVLFDGGNREHARVATAASAALTVDGHRVAAVDIRDAKALAPLGHRPPFLAVAVGSEATAFARALAVPLVFCQVFDHRELLEAERPVWGVAALPPIRLQFAAWRALDPSLERVALIVGASHAALAEAAVAAGRDLGITVTYDVAASDRETSYLFKRVAPQVDGVWLPPDGRILSPAVLRELLDYAVGHGVGVAVGNGGLLRWGALFSATGTPADIARTVQSVVAQVAAGRAAELPRLTPLSELALDVNEGVAAALGIAPPAELPWVLREPD